MLRGSLCVSVFDTLAVFSCVACFSFRLFATTAPLSPSGATSSCSAPLVMSLSFLLSSSFMVQTAEAQKRYRCERALATGPKAEARKAREREKNRESQRWRRARIAALANARPLSPTCEPLDEPMNVDNPDPAPLSACTPPQVVDKDDIVLPFCCHNCFPTAFHSTREPANLES